MAIDKVKYISKFDPNRIQRAKAHLYYIAHRKGRHGEKMERQLFNNRGDVAKEYAYHLIEASRGMNLFKIILNFDPKLEDTFKDLDLRSITHHVMLKVKEIMQQDFEWVAVMHNDHGRPRFDGTPKRHIHSMVFVNGRLERHHLAMLREVAHEQAMKQRRQLDLAREHRQELAGQQQRQWSIDHLSTSYRPVGMAGGKARRMRKARQPTIPCPFGGMHSAVKLNGKDKYYCSVHERVYEREQELSL
ncbi:MAG: hypothetical protein M3297_11770 [Thermoproteota archaeon]|nr:hypothetical protein [Thermoproteota archaeon]